MIYDIESYLLAIRDFCVSNLNTQVSSLNSEKSDTLVLKEIDSAAYFITTMNNRVANFNPYVLIGITNIVGQSSGPAVVKELTFGVSILLQDSMELTSEDLNAGVRILRYLRVLEDLFNNGFNKILPHAKFRVNSLVPIAVTAPNSNDPYLAAGVELVTTLG